VEGGESGVDFRHVMHGWEAGGVALSEFGHTGPREEAV